MIESENYMMPIIIRFIETWVSRAFLVVGTIAFVMLIIWLIRHWNKD